MKSVDNIVRDKKNYKIQPGHTCHICGSHSFMYKYSGFDYFFNKRDITYDIIECEGCGLEQIYPTPNKEEQLSFYPNNYYSKHLSEKKNTIKDKLLRMENILFGMFDKKYLKLPDYDGNNKSFLDIGCGDGRNLGIMKNKNRNVKGFEIDNKQHYENNIYYAKSITEIDFGEKFDVIWCCHVIEHVDNPKDFLIKIKNIMKDDGIVIINLPNVKGLSGYIFGKYAGERDIPRHLFGYNYKNIQLLFKNLGFKIIHKHIGRQGGTISSLACSIIGKYNKDIRHNIGLGILLGLIFIPFDFILSLIKSTNSMGFVLKKE